jgi:hypothetical protein
MAATVEMMRKSAPSVPDPFRFQEFPSTFNGLLWNGNQAYSDTHGRAPRNLTLNTGIRNLILISAGQSVRESQTPTTFVPTNASAIDNFNVLDGAIYPYQEPLLGCSYTGTTPGFGTGYVMGRVADKLISGGQFDRVILVPLAIGGSPIQWWANGPLSDRLPKTMVRLASRGFVSQANVTVAVEFGQGEADNLGGTTTPAYTASGNTMISNANAAGTINRWFIAQESWFGGVTSSAVTAAQASLVNGTTIFASGNIDTLNNSNRIDGTHLNDVGAAAAATLIYNAMHASGAPF